MSTLRFDKVEVGTILTVEFGGRTTYEERVALVGREGEGDDRRVTLAATDPDHKVYTFDIYRYNGRWAYGSSADPVRPVEVIATITQMEVIA